MWRIILVNSLVVAIAVTIHYEALYRITRTVPYMHIRHRFRIVVGVIGALVAHAAEVWVFAIAYYMMHHDDAWGVLQGNFEGTIWDCGYFSFTVFTTLGFGDITPKNWVGEVIVVSEVILGYTTLGLLLAILANRVARQS